MHYINNKIPHYGKPKKSLPWMICTAITKTRPRRCREIIIERNNFVRILGNNEFKLVGLAGPKREFLKAELDGVDYILMFKDNI